MSLTSPTPWRLLTSQAEPRISILDRDATYVAEVHVCSEEDGSGRGEAEFFALALRNAALLKAAPELQEASRQALDALYAAKEIVTETRGMGSPASKIFDAVILSLRNAIKKSNV